MRRYIMPFTAALALAVAVALTPSPGERVATETPRANAYEIKVITYFNNIRTDWWNTELAQAMSYDICRALDATERGLADVGYARLRELLVEQNAPWMSVTDAEWLLNTTIAEVCELRGKV
jgi:hypothetical protein